MEREWIDKIFSISVQRFDELAVEIFRFQAANNLLYKSYIAVMGVEPARVRSIQQIPFLPIRFFKSHDVTTTSFQPQLIFESSGTTGSINSRHLVKHAPIYMESFLRGFELFYGDIRDYAIYALLPSYMERGNSSLIYMVNELINRSGQGGFYLHNDQLADTLMNSTARKNLLIGVSYALLDLAEQQQLQLKNTIVMETGGMKGRREEITRQELHERLCKGFGLNEIHSEYGMTELLSQAYSKGKGIFNTPPWMRVLLRDEDDPLSIVNRESSIVNGVINVIDLANIYSCSFIATDDAGKLHPDGSFEVIGRIDNSDIRGCSLMVSSEW